MVCIQIRNHLKASIERDNLALDMFLQYPAVACQHTTAMSVHEYARQQPYPDLLVKHLEHLPARTPLKEFTVRLEAPDRFATALRRTEIEQRVFGRVVFPGLGQRLDDMVDLSWVKEDEAGVRRQSSIKLSYVNVRTYLVHQHLCPSVQPRGDTIVERILEPLLLPNDHVQKVGLVDM